MTRGLLSADWYRVAGLTPRLRSHVAIHRQRFRGDLWYVVDDRQGGRHHRLSPAANLMLNLMDGRRTVQSLWELACARFPDDPPTQHEVIRLLSQLHRADLVAVGDLPDLRELGRRAETQARQSLMQKIRNPLALRLPLIDPDAFLDATVGLVRPLFSAGGFLLWLALVVAGASAAVLHWPALTTAVTDQVLTAENLFLLALVYPLVKAVHELGHAYATKVWGGEVHEIGLMFLVLIPVPYVDASSASAFPEKWRRAVVAGAGIMVELALAAGAALFWINAEPGLARAFAFNVMLIGGVSTLLFNGNPLLRFDGYFVLCDVLEIPNLGTRANRHVMYLVKKRLLGIEGEDSPVTARGEAAWFVVYAVAAFLYRIVIAVAISLFIATKLFAIGVALALWSVGMTLLWPVLKGLWFLAASPQLRGRRVRAVGVAVGLASLVGAALFGVPTPYATVVHGVVWLGDDAILRAGVSGFVTDVPEGQNLVVGGDTVLTMSDPVLAAEATLTAARLAEMRLRRDSVLVLDRIQTDILNAQVRHLEERLADIEARRAALALTSAVPGQVVIPDALNLPGRFLRQGQPVGHVVGAAAPLLRVVVAEAEADLVRARTQAVSTRFISERNTTRAAVLVREVPGGAARLPSPAFSSEAGGSFPLDPADPERMRTLGVVFQFDVAVTDAPATTMVGERAWVRFDHGSEPVAWRLWRSARQLFLSHFNV